MRLTRASDFALRILILLSKADQALSVESISDRLGLPKSHVMKLVSQLAKGGFVATQRGRSGGVRIADDTAAITVGAVVRAVENEFAIVDCLGKSGPRCSFEPRCALKSAMSEATDAFMGVLDRYPIGDIAARTQFSRPLRVE